MTDTKTRILDAAERLFADQGFAATSLRSIIAAAGVNLAAVHYHFRSKEALLEAVILRRAAEVNRRRLEMLEQAGGEAPGGVPELEKVIEAFLVPTFEAAQDPARGGPVFVRLIGRIHAEGDLLPRVLKEHFSPVLARFSQELRRALPELPPAELFWRIHFSIGAMAQALRGNQELHVISGGLCDPSDSQAATRELIVFLSAGLRAPVPMEVLK